MQLFHSILSIQQNRTNMLIQLVSQQGPTLRFQLFRLAPRVCFCMENLESLMLDKLPLNPGAALEISSLSTEWSRFAPLQNYSREIQPICFIYSSEVKSFNENSVFQILDNFKFLIPELALIALVFTGIHSQEVLHPKNIHSNVAVFIARGSVRCPRT